MSRCPWINQTARPGRFCAVQRGPQPSAPAAHASASNSRGRLPHSRRGHGRGRAPCAEVPRVRRNPLWPGRRPRGRRLGQQRAGAALHHGPSAQHCRRRAGGSGPHRCRGSGTCSRAGFPLSDAAEYVRLNALPRPCQAQPPPQIIGRPSDVERLLDEAGQRAQEVERGAAQRRPLRRRRPWQRRRARLP